MKTRKKLAEWSKTPEGRSQYEKVAQRMRNLINKTENNEKGK
jgi:hypothetical protein